jgi:hypothetical protein
VATLKAELETWRAECGRLSQAGQAQINDRALGALVHIVTLFGSFRIYVVMFDDFFA